MAMAAAAALGSPAGALVRVSTLPIITFTSSSSFSSSSSSSFSSTRGRLVTAAHHKAYSALTGNLKFSRVAVSATSSDDTSSSFEADDIVATIKEKWDAVENKSSVIIYGGGALLAVWISSIIVGAINSVPLLPKLMELVGLGYTGWFVYRYLLFKSCRKELAADIEEIKRKITGVTSTEVEGIKLEAAFTEISGASIEEGKKDKEGKETTEEEKELQMVDVE